MNKEHFFFHAAALAAHGSYHFLKRYRVNGASWQSTLDAMRQNGVPVPDPEAAGEALAQTDIRIVLLEDGDYPDRLRHIAQPPFGIYMRGVIPRQDSIAIVGTRRASAAGKAAAHTLACSLARAGFAIASGLAFGIDAAAHEGCLSAHGATFAVLAGGLDRVYPGAHEALARRMIAAGGGLVSEYPPGEEPFGYRFIERNRIISGISRGTVIVEAPPASGALATARYAAEQNREVFVVPGPVASEAYKGSHALIRQGATLVTSADDILAEYGMDAARSAAAPAAGAAREEILILQALREVGAPADVDKIAEITRLEPRIVNRALSLLIIGGNVRESGGGYTI